MHYKFYNEPIYLSSTFMAKSRRVWQTSSLKPSVVHAEERRKA